MELAMHGEGMGTERELLGPFRTREDAAAPFGNNKGELLSAESFEPERGVGTGRCEEGWRGPETFVDDVHLRTGWRNVRTRKIECFFEK